LTVTVAVDLVGGALGREALAPGVAAVLMSSSGSEESRVRL